MISGDGERVAGGGGGGDGVPLFPKGNGLGRLDINSSNKFRPVALLGKVLKADLSDGIRCLVGGCLGGERARLLGRAAGRLELLLRLGGEGARLLGRAAGHLRLLLGDVKAGLIGRGAGRSEGGSLSEGHTSPCMPKSKYPFNVGEEGRGQVGSSKVWSCRGMYRGTLSHLTLDGDTGGDGVFLLVGVFTGEAGVEGSGLAGLLNTLTWFVFRNFVTPEYGECSSLD